MCARHQGTPCTSFFFFPFYHVQASCPSEFLSPGGCLSAPSLTVNGESVWRMRPTEAALCVYYRLKNSLLSCTWARKIQGVSSPPRAFISLQQLSGELCGELSGRIGGKVRSDQTGDVNSGTPKGKVCLPDRGTEIGK